MQQVINRMELASLNSGLAEAYMKEAEESLHLAVEKLEGCLRSVNQLRSHGFGTRAMDGKDEELGMTNPEPAPVRHRAVSGDSAEGR